MAFCNYCLSWWYSLFSWWTNFSLHLVSQQGVQKVLDVRFHPGGHPQIVCSSNEVRTASCSKSFFLNSSKLENLYSLICRCWQFLLKGCICIEDCMYLGIPFTYILFLTNFSDHHLVDFCRHPMNCCCMTSLLAKQLNCLVTTVRYWCTFSRCTAEVGLCSFCNFSFAWSAKQYRKNYELISCLVTCISWYLCALKIYSTACFSDIWCFKNVADSSSWICSRRC